MIVTVSYDSTQCSQELDDLIIDLMEDQGFAPTGFGHSFGLRNLEFDGAYEIDEPLLQSELGDLEIAVDYLDDSY